MPAIEVNNKLELQPELMEVKKYYTWDSMKVTNENSAKLCGEYLSIIKDHKRQVTDQKNLVLKPLKQATRAFEEMVKKVTGPLDAIDLNLRSKLGGYMTAKRVQIEEAAREKRDKEIAVEKAQARENMTLAKETGSTAAFMTAKQHKKNADRLEDKPLDTSQTLRLSDVTIAERTVWEYEIIDESKIPREYFILDVKKIGGIARKFGKEKVTIPGINFKAVSKVTVGG